MFLVTGVFLSEAGLALAGASCPGAFYLAELANAKGRPRAEIAAFYRDGKAWRRQMFDSRPLHRPPPLRDPVRYSGDIYPYRLENPFSAGRFMVDFKAAALPRPNPGDTVFFPSGSSGGIRATSAQLKELVRLEQCEPSTVSEIEKVSSIPGANSGWFYLLRCSGNQSKTVLPAGQEDNGQFPPVRFDRTDLRVSSSDFSYQMNKLNQMLFERMDIARKQTPGRPDFVTYLEDGAFDIRADLKNFFTMHFTSGNVESKVIAHDEGISGAIVRLTFDLRVLFLRLDLQLATDVMFLPDMAFLPMVMKIPADASRYVHPNTGVLYSWFASEGTVVRDDWMQMPSRQKFSSPAEIKQRAAEVAAKHCDRSGRCFFRAAVGRGADNAIVAMDINIRKDLLLKGFFPQYVPDPAGEKKEFGWSWGAKAGSAKVRQGLYFELSGLPKGEHGFEIWLRIFQPGRQSPEFTEFCPSRWSVRDISPG